jgi:hypothetical protein
MGMTRDEAVEKLQRLQFGPRPLSAPELEALNRNCSSNWIDAFVALGMLKLDQPASPRWLQLDKLCFALNKAGINYNQFGIAAALLDEHLPAVGLKIVEAGK